MQKIRSVGIIAALAGILLLAAPSVGSSQGLKDADALNKTAIELYTAGKYAEAIPLAQRALSIREKALGPDHPDVATSLNNLAGLYQSQDRYADAEPLIKRSLAIQEKALGPGHPDVAISLNNLARLYRKKGRYSEAEPPFKRSVAILEHAIGPDNPKVAATLNNLALLYEDQGRYADAEALFKRSLAIREKALGPYHPDVAMALHNLGSFYTDRGRLADAEPLIKRSLLISEKVLGPDHPQVARALDDLAGLYRDQGRYIDAEPLFEHSLAIREKALGPDHTEFATALNNMATLYQMQGRYSDAEPLFKRSLEVYRKVLGPDHPNVAISLNNLATVYRDQGRYSAAEPPYKLALVISEKLGPDHPEVATALANLAGLYRRQARYAEAEALLNRSLAILKKAVGSDHIHVATKLNDLAVLYQDEGRYADAELLYKRSLAIRERELGPDHPDVAQSMNNLAVLSLHQGRYTDAEPLIKRSLAIWEKALGPGHPVVALTLNNLAGLYSDQGRLTDAEGLFKRSLAIQEKALGPDHSSVATMLNGLAFQYQKQRRYADAEALYKRSIAIQEKALGPGHPDFARTLRYLAGLYSDQGRLTDAEGLYKRSLAIQEKALGPDHSSVATTLNNLASLYGSQDRAERLYKRSLAIREQALGPDHRDVAQSLNNLAVLYQEQGRYADALPLVRATAQKGFNRKDIHLAVLTGAVTESLLTKTEALKESYQVVQQSTSSALSNAINRLSVRFAAASNDLAQIVRREQDLSAENESLDKILIDAVSKEPSKRDAATEQHIRDRLASIAAERDQIQISLNERFPDFAALSKPTSLSVKDTQALLADDEALIVFYFAEDSYAWVITHTGADWVELKITVKELTEQVKTLRRSLTFIIDKPFDAQPAFQIYLGTFGAIAEKLQGKTRISVVTTGALTSLPLQLLITKYPTGKPLKDVDWLVRSYAITNLPSVYSLKTLRTHSAMSVAGRPMIAFADPLFAKDEHKQVAALRSVANYYEGGRPDLISLAKVLLELPETETEVRAIAEVLHTDKNDLKFGADASETTVKKTKLDDYRIIYFATHALVAGEVEKFAKVKAEPALALTIPNKPTDLDDGLLTASEIAQLKLNADWVVLSACNTAAEDKPGAEALSGLARAFFYAGARSLVVSHWEVDSIATVKLMIEMFQKATRDPKLSHAEALQQSILRFIENAKSDTEAHPRFWAPFVVVGEPAKQQ